MVCNSIANPESAATAIFRIYIYSYFILNISEVIMKV